MGMITYSFIVHLKFYEVGTLINDFIFTFCISVCSNNHLYTHNKVPQARSLDMKHESYLWRKLQTQATRTMMENTPGLPYSPCIHSLHSQEYKPQVMQVALCFGLITQQYVFKSSLHTETKKIQMRKEQAMFNIYCYTTGYRFELSFFFFEKSIVKSIIKLCLAVTV